MIEHIMCTKKSSNFDTTQAIQSDKPLTYTQSTRTLSGFSIDSATEIAAAK